MKYYKKKNTNESWKITNSHEYDLIFNCKTSLSVMQKCIDVTIKTKKNLKDNTTNNIDKAWWSSNKIIKAKAQGKNVIKVQKEISFQL
jgi:hypothetical protein